MNNLHKAYAVLGLEPGSSMESILRRYKRLIMVWHPDRAPSAEHKEFAEEELKKINNAKDLLSKHFGAGGGHKTSGCECQPGSASNTSAGANANAGARSGTGPGPSYHRTKSAEEKRQEEEAARKRDEQRKNEEAAEEAARRAQQQTHQTTSNQTMESAVQQQKALQDEKLRWQISVGLVIAFIALEFFGAGAINAKNWWHDVTWKWQNQSSNNTPPPSTTTGNTAPTPYIEPYNQTPGGNPSSWAAEQAQQDKERANQQQKQQDQDVYFTKLDIDKYQKIIEHCNSELTNLEIQIASPSVSDYEKNKLREMRDFRQKNLSEAQENLKFAQDKLANLTGQPVSTTPPTSLTTSPFLGRQSTNLFPSTTTNSNTSPFAPPADPNSLTPSTTTGITPFERKFEGLNKPLSTSPSLSELMKKYSGTSTTTPSSTRFSDLLKSPQPSSDTGNK